MLMPLRNGLSLTLRASIQANHGNQLSITTHLHPSRAVPHQIQQEEAEYAALLFSSLPTVIQSEAEIERYIGLLEQIDSKGNRETAAERRVAELLTLLIEDFGERHYALKPADPIMVLTELIDANGFKQKDLTDVFGTPSIVSEVLSGKRTHHQTHPQTHRPISYVSGSAFPESRTAEAGVVMQP